MPLVNRCDGGIKWIGNSFGNSFPSNLTLIKCNAKANSSISRKPIHSRWEKNIVIFRIFFTETRFVYYAIYSPSALQSANFHILLSTEFGSFDFINSGLAAVKDTKTYLSYSNLLSFQSIALRLWGKKYSPAPDIFPSIGFNCSNNASVRGRSRLHIQSSSPKPASTPSPRL